MKLKVIAALSILAGVTTAFVVHQAKTNVIAHHSEVSDHHRMMMYAEASPLEQGSGPSDVGPGNLPLDATPEPGYEQEPGSARPSIRFTNPLGAPTTSVRTSAKLVLKRTNETLAKSKDPVWKLELISNSGVTLDTLPALTGRANRQNLNRNQSGNKSPLPKGTYQIDRNGIELGPFPDPELGRGYWVPITPLFATGRSELGFHVDPSWGKLNGESGTSGCIGLENVDATHRLVTWIKHYNIKQLTVES